MPLWYLQAEVTPPPRYTPQRGSSAVPPHSGKTSDTSVNILIGVGDIPMIFYSHTLVNAMLYLPVDLQKTCHQVHTKFRSLNP